MLSGSSSSSSSGSSSSSSSGSSSGSTSSSSSSSSSSGSRQQDERRWRSAVAGGSRRRSRRSPEPVSEPWASPACSRPSSPADVDLVSRPASPQKHVVYCPSSPTQQQPLWVQRYMFETEGMVSAVTLEKLVARWPHTAGKGARWRGYNYMPKKPAGCVGKRSVSSR